MCHSFLHRMTYFVTLVTVILLLIQESLALQPCPAELDYGLCSCEGIESDGSVIVSCVGKTNAQIRDSFLDAPDNIIQSFQLVPIIEENLLLIATDLLVDKKARNFLIASCPSRSGTVSLEIESNGFNSSKDSAKTFIIRDCTIGSLDWTFLKDFNQLSRITLENVQGVQSIKSLPQLPSLNELSFLSCSGWNHPLLDFPGSNLPAIKSLVLDSNVQLTNEITDKIIETLATTLQELTLTNTPSISKVPTNLNKFPGLTTIDLTLNSIVAIGSADFAFTSDPDILLIDLTGNQVATIEKNAFSAGDYGKAQIKLDDNKLTFFHPNVFLEVLDEMYISNSSGLVSIGGNDGIICGGCELTWLVRDNPDYLDFVSGGVCTDFGNATFNEVDPDELGNLCLSFTPTTTTSRTTAPTTTVEAETTVSTTIISMTTTVATTTERTDDEQLNAEDNTLLYVIIGLVSFISFILAIGFIYIILNKWSKMKKNVKPEFGDSPEEQRRATPPVDTRNHPAASFPPAEKQSITKPATTPTPVILIPRPMKSFDAPVVQGPGGRYYGQPPTNSFN